MESGKSDADVYPASLLLAFRGPALLTSEQGERVINLVKVPSECWKRTDKVLSTRLRQRSSSKAVRSASAENSAAVTEVLPMLGDAIQQFVRDALHGPSGILRTLEASTGVRVSERQGLEGRRHLVVSGTYLAVEIALPQLEELLAAAERATAERPLSAARTQGEICSLSAPGLPAPDSVQREDSVEIRTSPVEGQLCLWHPGGKSFIRQGSDMQRELEEEAVLLIQAWHRKLVSLCQMKRESLEKLTPQVQSFLPDVRDWQPTPEMACPSIISVWGNPSDVAESIEIKSQISAQPTFPSAPVVRPPPPPIPAWKSQSVAPSMKEIVAAEQAMTRLLTVFDEWTCAACTLLNLKSQKKCEACGGSVRMQEKIIEERKESLNAKCEEIWSVPTRVVKQRPFNVINRVAVKAPKLVKQEEALNPLPQKNTGAFKAPRMLIAGLVVGTSCSNSASGPRWAERPVEKVSRRTCAEEEHDPDLARYLWNRRPNRSMAQSCAVARAWGVAR